MEKVYRYAHKIKESLFCNSLFYTPHQAIQEYCDEGMGRENIKQAAEILRIDTKYVYRAVWASEKENRGAAIVKVSVVEE